MSRRAGAPCEAWGCDRRIGSGRRREGVLVSFFSTGQKMTAAAIIGGSGLTALKNLKITRREVMRTPYGEPSAPLVYGELAGREVVFLPRHGAGHTIRRTASTTAPISGRSSRPGLHASLPSTPSVASHRVTWSSERLVLPDQIIDYTYDRKHTFFGNDLQQVTHIDFTEPYCVELRRLLIEAAKLAKLPCVDHGTYGATQGPRFESAAEIRRMERDGADIVGMTGMPEAGLARELELVMPRWRWW